LTRSLASLARNRVYEYRWVTWQALLVAPGAGLDYDQTGRYWAASPALKVKTLP
jgi:hypothetical protein